MAGDYARIESIFNQAADLRDVEDRAAYLDEICGTDQELRAEVEKLLRHDSDAGSFLEAPAVDFAAAAPASDQSLAEQSPSEQPPSEQPGTMIGHYKLIEEIGEGGMGSVFMALQKEPVRRKVALKVIKPRGASGVRASLVISEHRLQFADVALQAVVALPPPTRNLAFRTLPWIRDNQKHRQFL